MYQIIIFMEVKISKYGNDQQFPENIHNHLDVLND